MSKPILVFGATGRVGSEITRLLLAQDVPVVAAVRDPAKATASLPQHALLSVVKADLADAQSVRAVAQQSKAERAFLYAAGGTVQQAALEALRDGGITHVTFLSTCMVRPDYLARGDAIGTLHKAVEEQLEQLGLSYTFLRAGWFASNISWMWRAGIEHGELPCPDVNATHTAVTEEDIAAVAVRSLTTQELDRQAVPVVGEKELTVVELVALVSRVVGRPIRVKPISDAQYLESVRGGHMPEPIAQSLLDLMHDHRPEKEGSFAEARKVLGREPMSAEAYLEKHRADLPA